jgi:hypothetical protein
MNICSVYDYLSFEALNQKKFISVTYIYTFKSLQSCRPKFFLVKFHLQSITVKISI